MNPPPPPPPPPPQKKKKKKKHAELRHVLYNVIIEHTVLVGRTMVLCVCSNGLARTLKSYAHQRETAVSSNDSLQLCPFSKWELLLKERICSQRERILSFKSSSLRYVKSLLPY